jgi:hypothetical protein
MQSQYLNRPDNKIVHVFFQILIIIMMMTDEYQLQYTTY